ncbi:MAG: hypothetical protein LBL21_00925 [Rickettsiales bacterium]|jgi:hypothetical protein|nr:hypothetical protein [Rickettsiales bacterium]
MAAFLMFLFAIPAHAYQGKCQIDPRHFVNCDQYDGPSNLVDCSNNAGKTWCIPSAAPSHKTKDKNFFQTTTGRIAIAAAAGAVFVGAMWYLFRTPRSSNFDGQVRLATF